MKVLLIDDEKEFVTTLGERLSLRGIQARIALDGEEALSIIESDPPQLIVLDVMMPGINGLEVLQQLNDRNIQIPVILLTGRGSTKEGIEGMRMGASDFLMKPVSIEDLMEKMQEAVGGQ